MMADGSVVEASEDLDPDGRFKYLADNLLAPGQGAGRDPAQTD
jgi:hypothetical protein